MLDMPKITFHKEIPFLQYPLYSTVLQIFAQQCQPITLPSSELKTLNQNHFIKLIVLFDFKTKYFDLCYQDKFLLRHYRAASKQCVDVIQCLPHFN